MTQLSVERWMRGLALAGVLLCFAVIVLGAYVRITDAGLGCPDWPGCYGHVSPVGAEDSRSSQADYPGRPLKPTKAWHEMIHRYAAGTLGCVIIVLAALAIASRKPKVVGTGYALLLFATVIVQAVLGMLTVTLLLKPLIVTAHLIFGMTTLALLWWGWLRLQQQPRGGVQLRVIPQAVPAVSTGPATADRALAATPPVSREPASGKGRWGRPHPPAAVRIAYGLAVLAVVVLAVQFFLGGWTSANYAAMACPDFPTCQGAWWPHADYRHAFVLWRGLWVDYQGGILANPARVAIHFVHRLGALTVTVVFLVTTLYVISRRVLAGARIRAYLVLAALALQLAIGISMVLLTFPLWLTTAHTAGAALLLMAILALTSKLYAARTLGAA